ncbi:hypothetical protein ACWEGQ_15095 [Streptomyces seoulensis]
MQWDPLAEIDRPDRKAHGLMGKSDPVDTYAHAFAVASGRATRTPNVEALRAGRARSGGVGNPFGGWQPGPGRVSGWG